jgi:hypothetical protein
MNLPPRRVDPKTWAPIGVDQLEVNALNVVRSVEHRSVLAGPGAGKTELLAQRAAYLSSRLPDSHCVLNGRDPVNIDLGDKKPCRR